MRITKHWNRLSTEAVELPSLEFSISPGKIHLNSAWPCLEQETELWGSLQLDFFTHTNHPPPSLAILLCSTTFLNNPVTSKGLPNYSYSEAYTSTTFWWMAHLPFPHPSILFLNRATKSPVFFQQLFQSTNIILYTTHPCTFQLLPFKVLHLQFYNPYNFPTSQPFHNFKSHLSNSDFTLHA